MKTDDPTTHGLGSAPAAARPGAPTYEVHVNGRLGARWAAWFEGFDLTTADDGTTVLHGPVADQAALHGLLQKLRDLGIELLSLTRATEAADAAGTADAARTGDAQPDDLEPTTQNQPGATS